MAKLLRVLHTNGGAVSPLALKCEASAVVSRAVRENLVWAREGRDAYPAAWRDRYARFQIFYLELHMTLAGEEFLRAWRRRWWKRVALLVGGLVVAAESAVSLLVFLLGESR